MRPASGWSGALSVLTCAAMPGRICDSRGSGTKARTHLGCMIASVNTGRCGDARSPGSSRRARTTAAIGAFSSDSSIWRSASALSARAAASCASAWAMSSRRGPAMASASALSALSRCASATLRLAAAASRSCWATPRPAVSSRAACSRASCCAANSASAAAAAAAARACAISSGRVPAFSRASTCPAMPICASAWATRSRGVRTSSRPSTWPGRTRSPSRTVSSVMRSAVLKASDTWRWSTLPYSSSRRGSSAAAWRCHQPQASAAAASTPTAAAMITPRRRAGAAVEVGGLFIGAMISCARDGPRTIRGCDRSYLSLNSNFNSKHDRRAAVGPPCRMKARLRE